MRILKRVQIQHIPLLVHVGNIDLADVLIHVITVAIMQVEHVIVVGQVTDLV